MTSPMLLVLFAGCAKPAPPPEKEVPKVAIPTFKVTTADMFGAARVVDLTHTLEPDIPFFPGGAPFATEPLATIEANGYYSQRLTLGEHTGTHIDAAAHFVAGGATVDRIPESALFGPAAVVDISGAVAQSVDYSLSQADLMAWEQKYGPLSARHIVLVRTGWSERWPKEERYRNADAQGVMHFPGISVEASIYLADKGVRGLGIDTLSTDPGTSTTYDQHKTFLARGGYQIENLDNLEALPATGAWVVVAPLAVAGGSGAPARVIALVPGK